ncbi:effector-associated domain 2-containing protein [Actinoplanes ianthinogenes]|uniref:effector-associated domain 2-containing protein n=1 Tax=Actinoplanes ianthinogenes TaxID=122358 RepID=UPI001E4469B1|nr:hypothetical protein [Actinoplanes ianthinogenes]
MTVAIVTSLAVEAAAVRLVIDHPVDEHIAGDPHHYMVGTVPSASPDQPHRVVLAVTPADDTRHAAVITSNMLRSFPRIATVVSCGLASAVRAAAEPGGRPELRLGDVVTAADGIVDYGHVRSVDGVVRPRRLVASLSADLVRADRMIAEREVSTPNQLGTYLRRLTATAPHFRRPDPYAPQIHRGAVGSSDQLLRDIRQRDFLAEEFGVLGFEMEAVGVATSVQSASRGNWYVVRGISDYAEASKDDRWHPAAAAAAAAYVRMLLEAVPPLTSLRPSTSLPALGQLVDALLEVPAMRDGYEREAVIARLPPAVRRSVRRNPVPRFDVIALVQACLQAPEGMRTLLEAISEVADVDAVTHRRLEAAVEAYGSPSR